MPSLPPSLAWQALLAKKVNAADDSLTGFGRYVRLLAWMDTLHDPSLVLATHPWRHLEQLAIIHAAQVRSGTRRQSPGGLKDKRCMLHPWGD